ncbi:MAG: virulence protein RhuM/Fic/DOC family protein [Anaerolineae bacterium]
MTQQTTAPGGEVVLFQSPEGDVQIDVRLEQETVWLSLNQIADLFARDKSVISRHLRNVYFTGELEREATVAKIATVQREGDREVVREIEFFNLDAILSVGYRVNSKRGTQFRIWATRTLKEHLIRGYTLHERSLRERGIEDLKQAVGLLARTLTAHALVTDEGQAVLDIVQHYTRTWRLFLEYDEDRLASTPQKPVLPSAPLLLPEARSAIGRLRAELMTRDEASDLFGNERGDQLEAILGAIEQTFAGELLYPTAQVRASHLLYFLIKDHPFTDGNKRIGTLLFLEYLRRHGLLWGADGGARLPDSAMVALTLLVAESDPRQKELMIQLVLNLLEDDS